MGFNSFHLQMERGLWLHVLRGAGSVIFQFTAIRGSPKVPQGEDQTWGKNAKTLNRSAWSDWKVPQEENARLDCPENPGNEEKMQRNVQMRCPCNVVLLFRPRQGGGGSDWWPQLSRRRGTQADSWPPVAPDATVMEARGIVFHSGGQSAAQGSGHCSSQPGKQARGSKQTSRKESLRK